VLELWSDFIIKKPGLLSVEDTPKRITALACVGRVACLKEKVPLNVVKDGIVVVLYLAQPEVE
jgi:hypothetical protein